MGTDDGAAGDPGPPLDRLVAQPQGDFAHKEQGLGHRGQGQGLGDDRRLPQGQGQEQDQGNGHQVDQDAQEGDHLEVEGHQGRGGQGGHHRDDEPLFYAEIDESAVHGGPREAGMGVRFRLLRGPGPPGHQVDQEGHRGKGELEGNGKEAQGRQAQDDEGRQGQGAPDLSGPPQEDQEEVGQHHDFGPLGGGRPPGHPGIKHHRDRRQQGGDLHRVDPQQQPGKARRSQKLRK